MMDTDKAPDIITTGRALIDALYVYGFPVSEAAVAALEQRGNVEVKALHAAALAFIAAVDGVDAKLIAAAPEMLEALHVALNAGLPDVEREFIIAAIAKATGVGE